MTSEVELFKFGTEDVRIVKIEGEPWFIAKDVCDILEINNARQAISKLEDDEKADVTINDGSQKRHYNVVSESGLYALVFQSRKPGARTFTRWVTHIVLPQIRKTGKYAVKEEEKVRSLRMIKKIHNSNLEMDIDMYVHDRVTAVKNQQIEAAVTEFVSNMIDLTE